MDRDYFQIAVKHFRKQDFDRAEFYFKKNLENFDCYESFFYLGLIYSQLQKTEHALAFYYKSVSLNSDFGNPCNEIGILLLRTGNDKEAVFWLKKSVRCKRNDAPHISLFNLATLYKLWNRPERSLQYLHKAIQLAPEFEEAIKLRESLLN